MIQRLGHDAQLRATPDGMTNDDRYIIPGVGAFDEGVRRLQTSGWFDHLQSVPATTHILGICLGMQLLARRSDEGSLRGLQRVPAQFVRFQGLQQIPHMGWNIVSESQNDPIFDPHIPERRYYFSHSYYAVCDDPKNSIATTDYGHIFTSAYRLANTYGVQFHPEKSHKFGMSLFTQWLGLPC